MAAVGPAFADELFRVFAAAHPHIRITPVNTAPVVTPISFASRYWLAEVEAGDLEYSRAADKSNKSLEIYKFFVNALYVAPAPSLSLGKTAVIERILPLTTARRKKESYDAEDQGRKEWRCSGTQCG